MFKRILVPLDGSESAECVLSHVVYLAAWLKADVTLLHVLRPMHATRGGSNQIKYPDALHDRGVTLIRAYLDEVISRLRNTGVNVRSSVVTGEVPRMIVERARSGQFGLIALAHKARSGMFSRTSRTVFDGVWKRTLTPLMAVSASTERPIDQIVSPPGNVVLPLDGTKPAEWAVPYVRWVAKAANINVTIAGTLRPGIMTALRSIGANRTPVSALLESYLETKADDLRASGIDVQVAEPISKPSASPILGRPNPKGSLIVMASHVRSGWARLMLGSLGHKMIDRANGPVILVPIGRSKTGMPMTDKEANTRDL